MLKNPFCILIVEDDVSLSDILQEIFNSFGCQTKSCTNGIEALDILNKEHIDLVISDIKMPKMNGVNLLEAINEQNLNIPVVLMTGYSEYREEDILSKGGVVLLEKPFNKQKIKELFDSYIQLLMVS